MDNKLVNYGLLYCNRILNLVPNPYLMEFIEHFVSTMNADMVNLMVNMDICTLSTALLNDFKKLLEI